MSDGVRDAAPKRATAADRLTAEEFSEHFTRSSRALWCVAAAVLRSSASVEDVLQDAAIIGLAKRGQFRPGTSFTAWMGQIVRFVALNHARRGARSPVRASDPTLLGDHVVAERREPAPIDPRGELATDQASFGDEVVEALGDLGETQRACLLLRTVLDMPYAEIARVLDVPEGTAMSHVHRARRAMRDRLEEGAKERTGSDA